MVAGPPRVLEVGAGAVSGTSIVARVHLLNLREDLLAFLADVGGIGLLARPPED